MRTLKKTLALVLVVAMMMSLCITASAFDDADEITYTEAVDVLVALGVINGMGDGTFAPGGTLTRAQAAKIITYMLGAEDYAIATAGEFTDVPADHWAAGAISFCVDAGIVAGYGDGTFGPDDALTGYAWAKMLLCALGYNADSEGMTGSAWQINVAKLAKANNLFAGNLTGDKTAPATREEACLYAFNLLGANLVTYTGGTTFTVAGITFTQGGSRNQSEVPGADMFRSEYFPLLGVSRHTADAEGRPAHGWYYGSVETNKNLIGLYVDEAAYTYTTTQSANGLANALRGYTITAEGYESVADIAAKTGEGVLVELYINAYGEITDVIVAPAYEVVTVSGVRTAAATKTRGAYTTYTFSDGGTAKIFSTVVNANNDVDTAVIVGNIAKGDLVLKQTVAGVDYYYETTTVTGAITSKSAAGVYTLGGEQYVLSEYYTGATPGVNAKKEVTYLLDLYGNLIAPVEAEEDNTVVYGMVVGSDYSVALVDGKFEYIYTATIAGVDGTVSTIETDKLYELDGQVVTLTALRDGTTALAVAEGLDTIDTITSRATNLAEGLYADNSTVYVFANYKLNAAGTAYVLDGTVTTVVGKNNVGNYSDVDAVVIADNRGVAEVVFVAKNVSEDEVATEYVYVIGLVAQYTNYSTYNAIISGEMTTIDTAVDLTAGGLYEYVLSDDAKLVGDAYKTGALANFIGYIEVNGSADVTTKVADDAVVYLIDTYAYDPSVAVYDFADLSSALPAGDIYLAKAANGTVVGIYVLYDSSLID